LKRTGGTRSAPHFGELLTLIGRTNQQSELRSCFVRDRCNATCYRRFALVIDGLCRTVGAS